MKTATETELFVPCKKVKDIIGTKEFVMLEGGANLMASSIKPVDGDKGRRLVLDGPPDAQAAAMFTVTLRLTPPAHHNSISDHNFKCWYYISPAGNREGPFAARSLMVWLSKGQLSGSFMVQHGPSRVWIPLRLVGRHFELLTIGAQEGAYAPMPWPFPPTSDDDMVMTDVEVETEISLLRQLPEFLEVIAEFMDVDSTGLAGHDLLSHGSGSLAPTVALLHLPMPMDVDIDSELNSKFQALDSELEPHRQNLDSNQTSMGAVVATRRMRLYLVVDTNVLLRHDGVELLQLIRRLFAPLQRIRPGDDTRCGHSSCAGSASGTGNGGVEELGFGAEDGGGQGKGSYEGAAFSCVAVIPWTVLAELDGLKGCWQGRHGSQKDQRSCNGDVADHVSNDRPVAVMARSAVSLLLSALESGDTFFRGQTLEQFRAASSHPAASIPLGTTRISNDDRILQCGLHLQDELSSKAAATGHTYRVALLSNDTNLCVKTRMCGIPTTSVRQIVSRFSSEAASGGPSPLAPPDLDPRQLEAALIRLALQRPSTVALMESPLKTPAAAAAAAVATSNMQDTSSAPDSGTTVHEAHGLARQKAGSTGSSSLGGGTLGWSDMSGGGTCGVSSVICSETWTAVGGSSGQTWVAGAESTSSPGPLPEGALVGEFDLDEVADPLVAALHAELRRLTLGLAPLVRDVFIAEFQDLWTNVVARPPPWGGSDMLEVLHRHLESVFSERIGRATARQLKPVVEDMAKNARYFERGHGRPRREPRFLAVAEKFSQGVTDILRTFGVTPPPAPKLPAALLALGSSAPPAAPGHGRGLSSGGVGTGMGVNRSSGRVGSLSGGGASAVATMSSKSWHEDFDPYCHEIGANSASVAGIVLRGSGGGQSRTLHPAAARAAALAQSIGLSVNLGGPEMRGSSGTVTSPSGAAAAAVSPVAAVAGAGAVAANGERASSTAMGAVMQHEHTANPAVRSNDFETKVPARPDMVVDPQVAHLLHNVMLMMQQQAHQQHQQVHQQHQQAHQQHQQEQKSQQHQKTELQEAPLQIMRAVSESGHGASAAHQQHILLQQHLLHHHQRHVLERYYSDPPPAGDGTVEDARSSATAVALASMASAVSVGGSSQVTPAEVAARQLQLLQLHHQQKQQQQNQDPNPQQVQQMQQQQSQQAAWQHLFAQRAVAEVEALQQTRAQAQVPGPAQGQHSARVSSGGISPAGSIISPGASQRPSAAWQTLLAESQQRQQLQQQLQQHQQQQQLQQHQQQQQNQNPNPQQVQLLQLQQQQQQQQILLFHQAAAAAAAAAAADGAATAGDLVAAASAMEGGAGATSPEVLALLQQALYSQQR